MSTPPVPSAILEPFLRVIADVIVFNQQVAERLGLGMTDLQFLGLVQRDEARTPGQLAQLTGLSSGTVTGVLDRLEQAGYLHRERDPGDRRRVLLRIDDKRIQREFGPLYAGQAQRLGEAVARFDSDEQATIAAFLEALVPDRR